MNMKMLQAHPSHPREDRMSLSKVLSLACFGFVFAWALVAGLAIAFGWPDADATRTTWDHWAGFLNWLMTVLIAGFLSLVQKNVQATVQGSDNPNGNGD